MTGGAAAAAGSAAYAGRGLRGRQRLCVLRRSGPWLSNIGPHLEEYRLWTAAYRPTLVKSWSGPRWAGALENGSAGSGLRSLHSLPGDLTMRRDAPNRSSEIRAERPRGLLKGSLPLPSERYPLRQDSVMSAARFPAVLSVCVLSRGRHRPTTLRRDRAPVGTAAFPSLFESPHCGPARGAAVRRRKGACIVPDGYSGTSVSVDIGGPAIGVVGAGRSIDRFAVELVARHTRVIHPAPSSTGDGIPQNSQPGGAFLAHRYEKNRFMNKEIGHA